MTTGLRNTHLPSGLFGKRLASPCGTNLGYDLRWALPTEQRRANFITCFFRHAVTSEPFTEVIVTLEAAIRRSAFLNFCFRLFPATIAIAALSACLFVEDARPRHESDAQTFFFAHSPSRAPFSTIGSIMENASSYIFAPIQKYQEHFYLKCIGFSEVNGEEIYTISVFRNSSESIRSADSITASFADIIWASNFGSYGRLVPNVSVNVEVLPHKRSIPWEEVEGKG